MKKYETYKDSGLEWLGMVPEHWKTMKVKYICNVTDGTHFSPATISEGKPYITVSNVKDDFIDIESAGRISIADFNELVKQGCQPKTGDVLLAKDGTVGRTAIVKDNDYVVLSSLGILSPNDNLTSSYLKYMLDSSILQEQMNEAMAGSALRRITITKIKDFIALLPPTSEQHAIASYLDHKVGQIDALISEKEKMVEDLKAYRSSLITETVTKGLNKEVKMKDSGVEWIGKIPSDWTISKFKYICKINGRIGFRGYTTDDLVSKGNGAFTIGGKHISKNLLDLSSPEYISWEKYYESPEIMVKKGDIVSAQRGTLGRTAYIDKEIGPATINPSLVLINDIIEDAKFLYWFMVSNSFLSMIEFVNTATAVPMISQTQFGNTRIPLPPISEQHIIVEYLEKKISKIDTSISELEHQLSDLKSYKSSLITEAVTGKIDLRDWQTKKS